MKLLIILAILFLTPAMIMRFCHVAKAVRHRKTRSSLPRVPRMENRSDDLLSRQRKW